MLRINLRNDTALALFRRRIDKRTHRDETRYYYYAFLLLPAAARWTALCPGITMRKTSPTLRLGAIDLL